MNKVVNYLSVILGQDAAIDEYPELYKTDLLPSGLTLEMAMMSGIAPYRRSETRTFNWKNL